MPRCACASEVYGSVCVCLVDCYSCSMMNEVVQRFYRLLARFLDVDLQNNASFSSYG